MKSQKKLFIILILFAVVFSQLSNPQSAQAACAGIVYVRPGGNNTNGCSWTNAYTTLQSALNDATLVSGDQIWVATGTYYPDEGMGQTNNAQTSTFTLISGVSVYGGFAGTEPGTPAGFALRNSNPATNNTVLSGDIDQDGLDADNANTVVTVTGILSNTFILDGFTVTNGYEDTGSALGGGVYIVDTSPAFTNVIFSNNFAVSNGGGVFVISNASIAANYSRPTFTDVTFSNNSAARGGGLFLQNSSPSLTRVTFSGNVATGGAGGGINSQYTLLTDQPSIPVLIDVLFTGNTATGGGGMFVSNSNAALNRVLFRNNTANRRGGGMLIEIADPTLTNVTFNGNTSNNNLADPRGGGAIMIMGGTPVINNVTFSGNTSSANGVTGGGIRFVTEPANSVISTPVIRNSIFWGDATSEITSDGTGTITISNSIVQGGCPAVTGVTCTSIVNSNPLLSALANNGGFTETMALGVGSPAIDVGNNIACPTTDQRGIPRPQGAACDIGAFEFQKINQTIAFTSTAPVAAVVGGATYTPTATASSSLTVTLTIDATASAVCSISAGVVSFQTAGTCVVNANQAGDANYNAAPQVQQSFVAGTTTNPTVVSTTLMPSYIGTGPGSFIATFSTAVDDPAGNTGIDDVTNPANFLLVNKGINGVPNTASCAGGLVPDDTQVTVMSVIYNPATFQATVTLISPLPVGSYRLFICGTTSIVDLAGNPLNGGTDYTFDFAVQTAATPAQSTSAPAIPATGFPQGKTTILPAQPLTAAYASTDLWLEIPKLGVKMSIVGVPQTKNGWDVTWLDKNAGWLNGSAYPTWKGNSVVTAHVWDALNKPGPFAGLKDLKYGDQIKIHAFGQVFTYELRESTVISPTNTAAMLKHEEKSWLTLITCEDYKELTQKYPYRRMVRAVLVSVTTEK